MASRRLNGDAPPFIPQSHAKGYNGAPNCQLLARGGWGGSPPAYGTHGPYLAPDAAPTHTQVSDPARSHAPGPVPTYPTQYGPQFPVNVRISEPHNQQRPFSTGGSTYGYPPGAISTTPSIPPTAYPGLPDPFYDNQGPQYPQPFPSQITLQHSQSYGNPANVNPQSQAPQGRGNVGFENLPPGVPTHNLTLAGRRRAHYPSVNNSEKATRYAVEFTQFFGSSMDNLRSLRELAYCCGMSVYGLPDDIGACKTYLKTVFVNLFDLVDARRSNGVVPSNCVFKSGEQLRQYSLSNGKVCPGDSGQGNPLWKFMLKRWFETDYYEIDGTRKQRRSGGR